MKNFVQPGDMLDLVAPTGGVTSGEGVKIGSIIAIAAVTALAGDTFSAAVTGVFDVTAEGAGSGQVWAPGDVIYWDNTAKKFTKTSTSNTKAGYAVGDKLTADVVGRLRLIPAV